MLLFPDNRSPEKLERTAAAVEDVRLDSLRKKIKEDVRGVHTDKGRRMVA